MIVRATISELTEPQWDRCTALGGIVLDTQSGIPLELTRHLMTPTA